MPSRIPGALDTLSKEELAEFASRLVAERDQLRARLTTVRSLLAVCNATLRKGIIRLVGYGIPGLLGVFVAAEVNDLGVYLTLFALVMMVWEALDFAKEMSELRRLQDEAEDLATRSFWIDHDSRLIRDEFARREAERTTG